MRWVAPAAFLLASCAELVPAVPPQARADCYDAAREKFHKASDACKTDACIDSATAEEKKDFEVCP